MVPALQIHPHKNIYLPVTSFFAAGQQTLPDSLYNAFLTAENDSAKFQTGRFIYTFYEETNRDSALHYAKLRYAIAQKHNRKTEQAYTQGQVGYQQIYLGRFSEALTNLTEAKRLITSLKSESPGTWDLTAYNTVGKNRQLVLSMLESYVWSPDCCKPATRST